MTAGLGLALKPVTRRDLLMLRVPRTLSAHEVTSKELESEPPKLRSRKTRVAHWHLLNCRALENLRGRADERRSDAVFDAKCQICVQCLGVVRHAVCVGKHTIPFWLCSCGTVENDMKE